MSATFSMMMAIVSGNSWDATTARTPRSLINGFPSSRLRRNRISAEKLEVYWPGDNTWYAGTLTKLCSGSESKFFVLYDDGEKSWEALGTPDHRFRWLMPPTKRQKKIH